MSGKDRERKWALSAVVLAFCLAVIAMPKSEGKRDRLQLSQAKKHDVSTPSTAHNSASSDSSHSSKNRSKQPIVLASQLFEVPAELSKGEDFTFVSFDSKQFAAKTNYSRAYGNAHSYRGTLQNERGRSVGTYSVTVVPDGKQWAHSGVFRFDNGQRILLAQNSAGQTTLEKLNNHALSSCAQADQASSAHNTILSDVQSSMGSSIAVGLLVTYTPEARNAAGGEAAIRAKIINSIDVSNEAFENSDVGIHLDVNYITELSYTESSFLAALNDLTSSNGIIDEVHTLRAEYEADVVSMFLANEQYCGLGWVGPSESQMFSVVNHRCGPALSLAHEVAHNFGAHHDRSNAGDGGRFTFSYGSHFGEHRSVMAYSPGQRVSHFSNPRISYQGHVTGSSEADNARTLNSTALEVGRYRGSTFILSGRLSDNGAAIANARIDAGVLGSRNSDASGYFEFTNIPLGSRYSLAVTTSLGTWPSSISGTLSNSEHLQLKQEEQLSEGGPGQPGSGQPGENDDSTDSDGDGVSDYQENIDGTDPLDPGSYFSSLSSPVYTLWNGFLGMTNILELINNSSSQTEVIVTVYSIEGVPVNETWLSLAGNEQFDLILNRVPGFQEQSYGILKIEFQGALDGRISYYKPKAGTAEHEFAFNIPLDNPLRGPSAVSFNTFQPGTTAGDGNRAVANWLTLVNLENSSQAFTINSYDQIGSLLATRTLVVPPRGRKDVDGGHGLAGPSRVGSHVIKPLNSTGRYLSQLIRYGSLPTADSDQETFYFALPLVAKAGNGQTIHLPLSTRLSQDNWLEVINTLDQSVQAELTIKNSAGNTVVRQTHHLRPHSQIHIQVANFIGNDELGFATISSDTKNSIIAQSMYYLRDQTNTSVFDVYSIQAGEAQNSPLTGSFNFFLSMQNWLRISNLEQRDLQLKLLVRSGQLQSSVEFNIPTQATMALPLHDSSAFGTTPDTYGIVQLSTDGSHKLYADLLRVRPVGPQVDFASPTLLRKSP